METDSESPAGAGISGSSALMIASTAALARFTDRNLTLEQMRVIAQNVEAQIIQVPTGCQDYYPALYGGTSAIHLDADGIHREAVAIVPEEIESRFVLAYTGAPRKSGINNWEVFKAHINGDKRVFRNFERIVEIARAMHQALADAKWDEVARLLREEWKLRRSNAPGITTPLIDKLISVTARQGGRAAKACGAGGGGCVIFLVEQGAASRSRRLSATMADASCRCRSPATGCMSVGLKTPPGLFPKLTFRSQPGRRYNSSKSARGVVCTHVTFRFCRLRALLCSCGQRRRSQRPSYFQANPGWT